MTKLLIGVKTCQSHRLILQRAVAETWGRCVPREIPLFFIEGGHRGPARVEGNRVMLDCPDTYEDLALKTYYFLDFCEKGFAFDFIFLCDDDTYVHIPRLLASGFERHDYLGNLAPGEGWREGTYAQGGAYVLSRHAVRSLLSHPFQAGEGQRWWRGGMPGRRGKFSRNIGHAAAEDVMVGDLLRSSGIHLSVDLRFSPHPHPSPAESGDGITAHHLTACEMYTIHKAPSSRGLRRLGPFILLLVLTMIRIFASRLP